MRFRLRPICSCFCLALLLAWPWSAVAQQPVKIETSKTTAAETNNRQPEPNLAAPPIVTEAASPALAKNATGLHELSPWSMFLNADILVKAVMIGLASASVVTWTIFLAKSFELAAARRRLRKALTTVSQARSLGEAQLMVGAQYNILARLLAAAMQEAKLSVECRAFGGIKERAASSFVEVVRAEARAIRRGTGILATIGATAPFVGLFGTVWGIMNSFIGISKSQTTNLAVVAPGIAEALLATATGLVAAIPAVIIYNHFSRTTKAYLDLVGAASGTVGRILSRDLDRGYSAPPAAKAAE